MAEPRPSTGRTAVHTNDSRTIRTIPRQSTVQLPIARWDLVLTSLQLG